MLESISICELVSLADHDLINASATELSVPEKERHDECASRHPPTQLHTDPPTCLQHSGTTSAAVHAEPNDVLIDTSTPTIACAKQR